VPELRARVTDLAGLLSPDQQTQTEDRLRAFEAETTHQIALLTVPDLEGEAIESFSLRVVEAWGLGRRQFDNGVLLVVAPDDKRVRIEVGYGLEGVLPDASAARILREQILPHFGAGQMDRGTIAGLEAIMSVTRGEAFPPRVARSRGIRGGGGSGILPKLLFAGFMGGSFALPLARSRKTWFRALIGALLAGLVGWLLLPDWFWRIGAAALGAVLASSFFDSGPGYRRRARGPYSGGFGGGYGGGFGGGFGGGGGGFGGGGASGSW